MNSFLRGDCNLLDLAEKNQERERRLDHDASWPGGCWRYRHCWNEKKKPTLVWIETLEIRSLVDGTRSLPTRRTARFNDEQSHTCPCGLGNVSTRDWVSNRGEVSARQRNNKPGWEIWQTQHQRSCLLLLQGKLERRDEILFYFNNSAAQDNRPDGQRQDWESRLERLNSRLRRPVPDWSEEELIT